ncbi:MAG: flagellar basal body-associated FliL family protein [Alcanivorax sp.]
MAEEDQGNEDLEAEGGEELEEKKGGKKKLLFILLPLLLLGGGGGAAYYMGMLDSLLGKKAEEECVIDDHGDEVCTPIEDEHGDDDGHGESDDHGGDDGHAKSDDGHGDGHGGDGEGSSEADKFLPMKSIIVNLISDDGVPRNFRLKVVLELESSSDASKVEAVIPRIEDEFQVYLRELHVKDLRGSAGIYRLKMELLWRVNQAVEPIEIKDVLFQEILIQ